ncbi:hypothetical protein [Burkholderia pseudomallei]|uniref:hypothetical protein n=1 Tax=Burkholderia pseudomallei TaxID=28450 RepID=UPI000F085E4F|nr:hypothetical protein [Burkholderia pseudomallei]CAJ3072321.1 Uncharacterised protein [Burkholderia pseudomallei]VCK72870.1 Uncharacterised protein [Burkholderia pseudomallei]VCK79983.1 Uncharacterised protein [Burkholderia pseudomallei]VCK80034.1 Uncharacterised protein [Burkholderia pseudomallei]VCK80795.1 Uncharacterised protein [Burkholderia pseudomallei]
MAATQQYRQSYDRNGKKIETLGAMVEQSDPIKFLAGALDVVAMLEPKHLRRLEMAAAADEQANKATAQSMRGYRIDSVGHAIKAALIDNGVLTAAARGSLKTLILSAYAEAFYYMGLKPLYTGLTSLGHASPLLAIGEVAGGAVLAALAWRCGKAHYRSVNSQFEAARKDAGRDKRRNALGGAMGGLLRAAGAAANKLIPSGWAVRFANKHVPDSRAFALFQGVADLANVRRRTSWGGRIAAVSEIGDQTGFHSLKLTDVPNTLARSLAVNGLVPYPVNNPDRADGLPVGHLQAAMVTERHLGASVRTGVAKGLVMAAGFLAVWHPGLLDWTLLLESTLRGSLPLDWASQALHVDPLLPIVAGVCAAATTVREGLHRAYEGASVGEYDTDTIQQRLDALNDAPTDRANDEAYVDQVKTYNKDTFPRFRLGTYTGHMNLRGRHDAPLPGLPVMLSVMTLFQHLLITGGTGRGKTEALKAIIKQELRLSLLFKRQNLERLIKEIDAGEPIERAVQRYRDSAWTVPTLSLFLIDPKGALADLAKEVCNELGLTEDLRILGPDLAKGEYTVDLFAGLPIQKVVDLLQAAVERGAKSAEEIWGGLAKDVERDALVVAKVWQQTPEGLAFAINSRVKPFSGLGAHGLIFDSKDERIPECLEDIFRAAANGDPYVVPLIDEDFEIAVNGLLGETWLSAPAPETKMGIRVNIQRHLSPLVSDPLIRRTFGSGFSDRVMTFGEMWGSAISGCITASNISPVHGESATVMNTFIKSRLLFEADLREDRFNKAGSAAAEALQEIHRHLFQTELADDTLQATKTYKALQEDAWPILRRVADELVAMGQWNEDFGLSEQGEPLFGSGPRQSQYRRVVRWLRKERAAHAQLLRQPISDKEFEAIDAPEDFRKSQTAAGIARAGDNINPLALTSNIGFFRGDSIAMGDLLARNQGSLEEAIRGVREEEELLYNYIKNKGAPASPSEGLEEIPGAIERNWMMLKIDEYTLMATPDIDVASASTARSKRLSWTVLYQTQATAQAKLNGRVATDALNENLTSTLFLPDNSRGQDGTFEMARNFAGQVYVRPARGKDPEQPYEVTLHNNGLSDPTVSLREPKHFDDFCDRVSVDNPEVAIKLGQPMGDLRAMAAPLAMNSGRSRFIAPNLLKNRPIVDGDKDGINQLTQWKDTKEEKAEDKETKRLETERSLQDAITRQDWVGLNRPFFTTLIGQREISDFIKLDVDQKAIVAEAKEELARCQALVLDLQRRHQAKR